jgi:hypothetical protein
MNVCGRSHAIIFGVVPLFGLITIVWASDGGRGRFFP